MSAPAESAAKLGDGPAGIPQPVLVRGTGLLGASIGIGLSAAGVDVRLHDPSPAALAVAADIRAGRPARLDAEGDDLDAAPGLVVVAAPPDVTADVVVDSLRRWPAAVVVDIASVKEAVATGVRAAVDDGRLAPQDADRYLGTHPMAGSERSGPVAARGTLFTQAPWVLCPTDTTHPGALAAGRALALTLQATPYRMAARAHDESVALISHLPQIAASLVAARLQDTPDQALALAGNGLRDTTRIAASDPQLWVQILSGNAGRIVPALHGVREDLDRLISTLEDPTGPGARLDMAELIAEGNAGQARIPGKHGGAPKAFAQLTVLVDDKPGTLGELFSAVGETGINLEDLRLEHSLGRRVGLAEISVDPNRRDELVEALEQRGWKVVQ